ncbi:uncharacterized protein JCM10292_001753 [Rhodotorula paludigena]|uniref:uncharacterized protein n=1 Tax=Rhodotorula paludigena TaxID=86838 RepID=UPI00316EFA45
MDDDDAQTRADDEFPQSSPRRLFDAFTASTSPAKTRSPRLRSAMLPPQSPRRSAVAAKEEEPVLPAWSFYEDGDEMDASFAPAMSATPPVPVSDAEVVEEPQPVDKENTRPPRRPRRRSTSVVSTTSTSNRSPQAVSPTQVATSPTLAGSSAQPSPTRAATAPASPSAPHTPPALASPSLSLAFPASASAASTPFFAEMGPTSFAAMATSSVGGHEEPGGPGAGFLGLLPAFSAAAGGEAGHEDIGHGRLRGKKRESLEEPGGPVAEAKRARKDEAS